jgi:hypothetical protein
LAFKITIGVYMKTIIAGSRSIEDYDLLKKAIEDSGIKITTVISGCAKGVDSLGEKYAIENNIPIIKYPAEWNKYGRSAGPLRNIEMAKIADALIAICKNNSRGTTHMIQEATSRGLMIYSVML